MQTHCLFPASWFVVRADRVSVDVCCHSLSPRPPLFVVTTNLPPTLCLWGIHPRPAFYCDPNAPGFVGVWECASFSRTSWSESSNKLQGQQKNTRCPRSLKKTEAAQRKRWRAALLKPSKIRTFTSLCWKHLIKTCLLYFDNHTLISVTAVRAAQMCWVQRFSAKSGLS